jgi:GTP cyclohydrolase I
MRRVRFATEAAGLLVLHQSVPGFPLSRPGDNILLAHITRYHDAEGRAARHVRGALSKLARVVEGFGLGLQAQERLTKQIADFLDSCLQPRGGSRTLTSDLGGHLRPRGRSECRIRLRLPRASRPRQVSRVPPYCRVPVIPLSRLRETTTAQLTLISSFFDPMPATGAESVIAGYFYRYSGKNSP